MPLLLKISGRGKTRFNVHIGPQINFLLRGEETNTFTTAATVTNPNMPGGQTTVEAKSYTLAHTDTDKQKAGADKFNVVDPMAVLGFGVEHDFSDQLYLTANLRFNYGFTNILDKETVARPGDLDTYTLRYNVYGGLQIGLHYFFQKP